MELDWNQCLLACFSAFMACLGFTLVFNIHGVSQIICGLGGALGWLVYLLRGSTISGAFLAAVCIGVYSEVMSRVRKKPVSGCLLVSLLPLVPGGGIYHAMRHCIAGETDLFLETLLTTLGMAAALATGAMLASSIFRTAYETLRRLAHHTAPGGHHGHHAKEKSTNTP